MARSGSNDHQDEDGETNAQPRIKPSKPASWLDIIRSGEATERTPLLRDDAGNLTGNSSSVRQDESNNSEALESAKGSAMWKLWIEELRVLSQYTAPVFGTQLLEQALSLTSVVSIGHISTTHLAGSTLGYMTANVTGFTILLGFVSALDSLLPQAWTSHPPLVGLWSQRMGVLMLLLLVPIYAVWFSIEPILLWLKQEPEVAHFASLYLRWLSMALPAFAFSCISRRYLQSQGLMHVPTMIMVAVTPLNIFLSWLFVWGPQSVRLGFIGAPIATSISFNIIALAQIGYIVLYDPRTAWHPVSSSMFRNLGILLRFGAAGIGQVAADWWGWEIIGLAASLLGPTALASQAILIESTSTTYQAPYALSIAASVRIGNHLGAGQALHAKIATYVSLLMSLGIMLFFSIVFLAARNHWALLFNSDPEVRLRVAEVIPILALFQIFDGLCAVTAGVLRSRGKQGLGAVIQFVSYYLIGMPLGLLFTFRFNMSLPGLWMGMAVALIFGGSITTLIVLRTDWDQEVRNVAARLAEDSDAEGDRVDEEAAA